ncbi:MAG: hypothetical protein BroJett007_06270 [Chloroflexota bacterium]|nr:MAG: hypothetical protein BroJett007_06270 [Chloroflexota bacterium]
MVTSNVQVLGSAIHPNFLQYQLEYGPDPNPGNLWYAIGGPRQFPVLNGVLGIWSTNTIPDGSYQLRLRVYLRDGSNPQTVVNNIRVQNAIPTPVPTYTPSIPRPIAAFTQDRTSGEAPLVVRFTNRSTGQISGYNWSFGDGSSSAEISPVHVFRAAGEYEVKLTVVGPGGQSNVSQIITVNTNPPVAMYEQSAVSGPSPLTVQFTDRSTGTIDSWRWDFGDGTTSNERSPRKVFTTEGTYNISLRVRGPGGTGRAHSVVTVSNPQVPPPQANFTPTNTGGIAPLSIQYTDTSQGQITSRLWEFGDGTTSTDQNPIHQFVNPGVYTVRLTVNGPGGTASLTGTVTVTRAPQAPEARFTANPTSGDAPLIVTFQNFTSGDVSGYRWDFGDGTPIDQAEAPTHTYTSPGTYRVRLTALGPDGLSDTAEADISVTRPLAPPSADFNVSPEEGSAPLDVQFNNLSSGDDIQSNWDFGDGESLATNEPIVFHTYEENGTYTVILTVVGPGGPASSATRTITVTDRVQAAFEVVNLTDPPGLGVAFQDRSTGNLASWNWSFGDGGSSTDQNPSHTYGQAGTYEVRLVVTSQDGVQSEATQSVTVSEPLPPAPEASFEVTVDNLTAQFTNTSTGQIDSTSWNFGDGQTSSESSPSHTFAAAGTYTVELIVSNAGGADSFSLPVTVTAPPPAPPVSAFSFSVQDLTVTLTDQSTGEGIFSWAWEFGDGASSNEQNPTYTFAAAGTYRVRLTVTNAGGNDRSGQDVTVTAPLPDAPTSAFTFTVNNLDVQFTDLSTGQIDTWQWDFGDGATSTDQNPAHTYAVDGTYTVRLTVANAGGSNFSEQQVSVSAPLPNAPTSAFTFTVNNLDVQFTDLSTGQIDTWQWDFGDGTTSTDQNPAHAYAVDGTYTVRLTVANAGGSNFSEQRVSVSAPLPNAPTSAFTFTVQDLTATFTDTSTGEGITTWFWDFGDGATSTDQNPAHAYAVDGTYTVRLTVANAGGSNFSEQQVSVSAPLPNAPTSAFTFTVQDLTATFTDTSTGEGITTWFWEFGDGATSNEQNPTHVYAAAGTYRARLTVTNAGGDDRSGQDVTVTAPLPPAPQSAFTFSVNGLDVQFTDLSTGQIDSYFWEFGDGTQAFDRNPAHSYATDGTYTVRLTVANAGGSNTSEQQVTVTAPLPPAPQSAFTFSVNGLNVQFTDLSTGQIDSYFWEFGDGTQAVDQNPAHAYPFEGSFTVRLTVSNAGGSNTSEQLVTVTAPLPPAPVASFTYSTNNLDVQFSDLSTGTIDSWFWDFGDGTTAGDQNPFHTYATPGTYRVILTVSNAGGSNQSAQDVTVSAAVPNAPVPDFTFDVSDLTVTFTDATSGEVTDRLWEFGDGGSSAEVNPTYTYTAYGEYTVRLTVSNAGGSNMVEYQVFLQGAEQPPEASIADTAPVEPNVNELAGVLSSILGGSGNNAASFAVIGEKSIDPAMFLSPFGDGQYELSDTGSGVDGIIQFYLATTLSDGSNPFQRVGAAVDNSLRAANFAYDFGGCGDTLVACELDAVTPAITIISLGYQDGRDGTSADDFRAALDAIVTTTIGRGSIPLLLTPYPRPGEDAQIKVLAEVIINYGRDNSLPVINVWRMFNELVEPLSGNSPSVANQGPDRLGDNQIARFGENARNYYVLNTLQRILQAVGQF